MYLFQDLNSAKRYFDGILPKDQEILVLQDDPFLPERVYSLYEYYLKRVRGEEGQLRDIYFPLFPVPSDWEIRGYSFSTVRVWNEGKIRGEIHLREPYADGYVKSAVWLDETGKELGHVHYNRMGCAWKRVYTDELSGTQLVSYSTASGSEWLLLNNSNDTAVMAHDELPQLHLDLHGNGEELYKRQMTELISSLQAEEYIHLKGYQDVSEQYCRYEVYLTASLWETLGLSVMEAAASGNVLIGLDVRHGNRLFIQNEANGYRIPFSLKAAEQSGEEAELLTRMADAIVHVFTHRDDLSKMSSCSYEIAKQYLNTEIEARWLQFMEGMLTS